MIKIFNGKKMVEEMMIEEGEIEKIEMTLAQLEGEMKEEEENKGKGDLEVITELLYGGVIDLIREFYKSIRTGDERRAELSAYTIASYFREAGFKTNPEKIKEIRQKKQEIKKYDLISSRINEEKEKLEETNKFYNEFKRILDNYEKTITQSSIYKPSRIRKTLEDPLIKQEAIMEFNQSIREEATESIKKLFTEPRVMKLEERVKQYLIGKEMERALKEKKEEIKSRIIILEEKRKNIGLTENEIKEHRRLIRNFEEGFDKEHNYGTALGRLYNLIKKDLAMILQYKNNGGERNVRLIQ